MDDFATEIRELVESGIRPVSFEEVSKGRSSRSSLRQWMLARRPRTIVFALGAAVIAVPAIVVSFASIAPQHSPTVSASAILLEAAKNASLQTTPVPGPASSLSLSEHFLIDGYVEGASGQSFHYNIAGTGQWLINQDGTGTEKLTLADPTFPTSADRSTWQGLGSLTLVGLHQIVEPFPLSEAVSEAQAADAGLGDEPASPVVLSYSEVSALPTDPAVLEQQLVDQYEDGHFNAGQTFDLASTLLEEGAGPAQRAALYKMVASLPNVSNDGPAVTDVTHVSGQAVSIDESGVRHELIFDPTTSAVLEERFIPDTEWPTSEPDLGGASAVGQQMIAYVVYDGAQVEPGS